MEKDILNSDTVIQKDITKFRADIIVNSVGVGDGVKEYGGVCGAIIRAAKSIKLKDAIDKAKDVYVIGEFFFTKGYELAADNIVHLITPYFEEDQDFVIYKDCIRRILNACRLKGFKTIGIPLIGTGANDYDEDIALKTLMEIVTGFNNAYNGEVSATVVLAPSDVSQKNKERLNRDMPLDRKRENIVKDVKKGSAKYLKEHKPKHFQVFDRAYFEYDENDNKRKPILPTDFKHEPDSPMKYADAYTELRYMSSEQLEKAANERVRAFVGYGDEKPKTAGSKAISKLTMYSELERYFVMIFGLKMNIEEAEAFLHYFGRSLPAPRMYPEIKIIKELIKNKIYDLYEIKAKTKIFSK